MKSLPHALRTGLALGALSLATALSGCFSTDAEDTASVEFSAGLRTVGENVIYPTYADLAAKAAALETAVLALDTTADATKLDEARAAWRAARAPWEKSEAFLFGPVDTKSVDPSIDSWPLDSLALKSILATSATFNTAYVDVQTDEVKGFHAIEYLLYGVDGTKTRLTERELDYAKAAASHFRSRTDTLKLAWDPAAGNFLAQFVTAGKGSTVYPGARAAAEELLEGMIGICDEVASGKITEPYENGSEKEESRFSRNSTNDFANNMRSVRNVYRGVYADSAAATDSSGVRAWVAASDSALAVRVEAEIDTAIARIEAIGDFTAALSADRPKIVAARAAIFTLMETLNADVRAALFP